MPNPKDYKDKESFMKACIPMVQDEGTAKNPDQAVAICSHMWQDKDKKKNTVMKKLFVFNSDLVCHYESNLTIGSNSNTTDTSSFNKYSEYDLVIDKCVMIVGEKEYNGVHFFTNEIKKSVKSFDGVPINIDHSDDKIGDIVGYIKDVKMDGDKLICVPVFDRETKRYDEVMGYIKTRFNAGSIPNVSIGAWVDIVEVKDEEGKTVELWGFDIEGDHLAVVVHGACSPSDGCGIGLTNDKFDVKDEDYVNNDEYKKTILELEIEKEKNRGGKK